MPACNCWIVEIPEFISPVTLPVRLPVTLPVMFPLTSPLMLPFRSPVTLPVRLPVTLPVRFPKNPCAAVMKPVAFIFLCSPVTLSDAIPTACSFTDKPKPTLIFPTLVTCKRPLLSEKSKSSPGGLNIDTIPVRPGSDINDKPAPILKVVTPVIGVNSLESIMSLVDLLIVIVATPISAPPTSSLTCSISTAFPTKLSFVIEPAKPVGVTPCSCTEIPSIAPDGAKTSHLLVPSTLPNKR